MLNKWKLLSSLRPRLQRSAVCTICVRDGDEILPPDCTQLKNLRVPTAVFSPPPFPSSALAALNSRYFFPTTHVADTCISFACGKQQRAGGETGPMHSARAPAQPRGANRPTSGLSDDEQGPGCRVEEGAGSEKAAFQAPSNDEAAGLVLVWERTFNQSLDAIFQCFFFVSDRTSKPIVFFYFLL